MASESTTNTHTDEASSDPAPNCASYFRDLHARCGQILEDTIAQDDDRRQAQSHALVEDLGACLSVLDPAPETYVWRAAVREYQFALLALAQGHYRNSFVSLRLFLELTLGAVHYSANRLELQEWLGGDRDLNWNALTDSENGVLSKRFARAFFPGLQDEVPSYTRMAKNVYRECSEYVHGNRQTHDLLPEGLGLQMDVFHLWHEKADVVGLLVFFAYSVRYLNALGGETRCQIESVVLDRVGHLPAVRALFDGSGGF